MTEQQSKNKYRSSFGATLLFSGVQFYQIFIRVIKSKFIALFIGPAGMGISSLLHTTAELISASTNLGLKTSGVKTVSAAYADNDNTTIVKTITVLRRLILLTGLFGMAICAILASVWSRISFGNEEYVWSFVFVSLLVLFEQLNNGELVLLQGMRQKKSLAQANVIGQTLSLFLTVPLYYFYGLKAIVWVLVLSPFIAFCISRFYTNRLHLDKAVVSWKETFTIGKEMIKLGFFLSLQFLMSQVIMYVIRNFVSNHGGIEEVGLYSAGTAIVTTYLGLVFSAIATDYYPRLAATRSNEELSKAVHIQAEISILLFAPLIVAFFVFIKSIIILLYSDQFLPIEGMMYWSVGATLIQAMGWAVSYTLLAKAKPSYFFLNEVVASCYTVPLRLIGYSLFGLVGFGIATLIGYSIYLVQVLIVTKYLFHFKYTTSVWALFALLNIPVVATAIVKYVLPMIWGYIIGSFILILTAYLVFKQLDKKLELFTIFRTKLHKMNHR